jgi:hypothetical protein
MNKKDLQLVNSLTRRLDEISGFISNLKDPVLVHHNENSLTFDAYKRSFFGLSGGEEIIKEFDNLFLNDVRKSLNTYKHSIDVILSAKGVNYENT